MSKSFLEIVNTLKDDVFKESGLPTLRTKDEVRKIRLKLRNFESASEDLDSQLQEEKKLREELQALDD